MLQTVPTTADAKRIGQLRVQKAAAMMPWIVAIVVAAVALLALVGWALNIEVLKSFLHPKRVPMNPATAVAFLISAIALWFAQNNPPLPRDRWIMRACGLLILLLALARMSDYWIGTHFASDRILFASRLGTNIIAPNTAVAFALLGVALLTFEIALGNLLFHPAQLLIIFVASVGMLSLTGYLYHSIELYGMGATQPMALNSALLFTMLSVGFLCSRRDREPVATATSTSLGGSIARRLIPAAFVIPLLLGLATLGGERIGLFDESFAMPFRLVLNILVFNLLVWWLARVMHKADVRRKVAEEVMRASEERNRAVMEQAAEGIFLVDLESKRLIDANHALERILGYERGEARGLSVYDLVNDTPAGIDVRLKAMAESGQQLHGRRRYKRKDGSLIEVETSAGVISFGGRKVVCSAVHDITEQKKAEEALNTERNTLRTLIDNIPDSIFIKDADGRYMTSNIAHARFAGAADPEKLRGKSVFDLHPPEVAQPYADSDRRILDSGKPMLNREEFITDSEGNHQWAMVSKIPLLDARGKVSGMVGITRDITFQKKAEEALASERNLLRTVIDNLPDRIYVKDRDGRYLLDNIAHQRHLGVKSVDEIVGKSSRDFFPPAIAARFEYDDNAVINAAAPLYDREESTEDAKGEVGWLLTTKVPLRDARGQIVGLVGLSRDITARKRAEEILRQSEEKTRMIVETAQDAFISMDSDGKITGWNEAAERTFGWTRQEAIGRVLADTIIPPQYRELHENGLAKYLQTGEGAVLNQRIEISALFRDGHEFPVELIISPLRAGNVVTFNAFVHDITDRKRAAAALQESNQQLAQSVESEREAYQQLKSTQSQLVQSEKLAGLGQMVAGVAHEINNPLSFVSNNVAVLQRDIRGLTDLLALYSQADQLIGEKNKQLLDEIADLSERMDLAYTKQNMKELLERSREGLRRIQQIVKDLRDFARLDESDLHEIDLNAGIESTVNIVHGKAKKKRVQVDLQLAPLPMVSCYPAKINQVVMNLVTNAIDASPEGGKVTVRTEPHDSTVRISVSDTGKGVPREIRGRIFDPFFTTKPIGEGTGLGLSISYGIVHDHGGQISVESEIGKGSRFIVRLPVGGKIKVTR
jgi:PAS domain S-box-containing protein